MKVDYVRGARAYIRAADMIAGAPVLPEATQLHFTFRHLMREPGVWIETRAADASATLTARTPGGIRTWSFTADAAGTKLRRMPDIDEDGLVRGVALAGDRLTCRLQGDGTVWDQIVAATRIGGEKLFPGTQWYLIYLQINGAPPRQAAEGATLELKLGRRKGQILELSYDLDGRATGRIGLFPR